MDSLFRTHKAEPTDVADVHAAGGGNVERPLRALLAASIVLPVLIFSGVSWTAYHRHFQDARERLETTLGVIHEHALKVFETFELTARYTDELFADVSDEQMIASEAHYHERLKVLTDTLPQLRDIWVIDRAGHPLVSGTLFPMPRHLDLSDRDFFAFLRDQQSSGTFISDVIQSRAADRQVIVIARRRVDPAGVETFHGIMTTAMAPEYFNDYYATLPLPAKQLRYAHARGWDDPGASSAARQQTGAADGGDADFRRHRPIAEQRVRDRQLPVRHGRAHGRLPPATAARNLRDRRRGESHDHP